MRSSHVFAAAMSLVLGFSAIAQTDVPSIGAAQPVNARLSDGVLTDLVGLTSFRDSSANTRNITAGDTFQGAVIVQASGTGSAAFATNTAGRVTTFTYDLLGAVHGTLVGSNATVNEVESETVTGAHSLRIRVGFLTADSSSLFINGLTIAGSAVDQGRIDVGGGAFTNGLLWDNLPGTISSVTITNALFADGVLQATSIPLTNLRTLPEMGSAIVWNGVTGTTVDESQMIFDVTYVPEPAALGVLGLGAIVATVRRRR